VKERILIARIGAFGDCIIITPLIRHLKQQGHEIYVLTSERGMEIFSHNPHIDKLILHKKDSVHVTKLRDHFKVIQETYECGRFIDLCESIECNLAFHPSQPMYNYDREERKALANKNYYEETFNFAKVPVKVSHETMRPEVFFTEKEEVNNTEFRSQFIGKKLIVWGLSGSALHKSYPYTHIVMSEILNKHEDVVFITVGDEGCEILEQTLRHERVVWKSNRWNFREAMCMVSHAFAMVSPDTGILHCAGAYDLPKIGLLTSVSKTNITKYFKNDHSIQSDVPCAPCYRLIYDASVQCPTDSEMYAPFCNAYGISPQQVIDKLNKIIMLDEVFRYEKSKEELSCA